MPVSTIDTSPGLKAVLKAVVDTPQGKREIEFFKLSPRGVLARRLQEAGVEISRQAVAKWKWVPDDRIEAVAALTGLPEHIVRG